MYQLSDGHSTVRSWPLDGSSSIKTFMLIRWLQSTGNTKTFPPFSEGEEQSSTSSAINVSCSISKGDSDKRIKDNRSVKVSYWTQRIEEQSCLISAYADYWQSSQVWYFTERWRFIVLTLEPVVIFLEFLVIWWRLKTFSQVSGSYYLN